MESVFREKIELSQQRIIENQLPAVVLELIGNIEQAGFNLTLVGGAVRDFLIYGELSKDLDFELSHQYVYSPKEWANRINMLGTKLSRDYGHSIEFLNFSILRITFAGLDWDVELAPARIESFSKQASYGHSDVTVELISKGSYEQTFLRRDFSINAIGIEFEPEKKELYWIDPFKGRESIANKELVTFNPNFTKDPVRFCRAIRFQLKFDLKFGSSITNQLTDFNLLELSSFYFFREAAKVGYFPFFNIFFELVETHSIEVSPSLIKYNFLADSTSCFAKDKSDLISCLIIEQSISLEKISSLAKDLGVKAAFVQNIYALLSALKELKDLDLDLVIGAFLQDPSSFVKDERLIALKNIHQVMYREDIQRVLKEHSEVFDLSRFEKLLPQQLLGRDQFLVMLKSSKVDSRDKGMLQYYCHFEEVFGKSR